MSELYTGNKDDRLENHFAITFTHLEQFLLSVILEKHGVDLGSLASDGIPGDHGEAGHQDSVSVLSWFVLGDFFHLHEN